VISGVPGFAVLLIDDQSFCTPVLSLDLRVHIILVVSASKGQTSFPVFPYPAAYISPRWMSSALNVSENLDGFYRHEVILALNLALDRTVPGS
jgi:hypothetical protein